MDYEKAYKEALERAKDYYKANQIICDSEENEVLSDIFPELKESEEKKVKRILHSISSKMSFHLHDIFTEEEFQCFDAWSNAWLKKQALKPKWSEEDDKRQISITEYLNELYDDNRFSLDELTDLETWLNSLKQRIDEQQ